MRTRAEGLGDAVSAVCLMFIAVVFLGIGSRNVARIETLRSLSGPLPGFAKIHDAARGSSGITFGEGTDVQCHFSGPKYGAVESALLHGRTASVRCANAPMTWDVATVYSVNVDGYEVVSYQAAASYLLREKRLSLVLGFATLGLAAWYFRRWGWGSKARA